MSHTEKTGFRTKLLAALFCVLIVPVTASARDYTPATQACKDCVMSCVMGEANYQGKKLKLCFSMPWETIKTNVVGSCNPRCPDVNRANLAHELWQLARKNCEAALDVCLKRVGDDNKQIMLCRGEEAICKTAANRFLE